MASYPDEETAMRLASEQDRAPRIAAKKAKLPLKAPCGCKAFCLEDLARTGRYCKLEAARGK